MSCGCLTLANKEEKCPRFPIPAGLLLFQRCHRIIEWNHLGWKHSLRSSSASLYLALPGPPLNPIPEILLREGRRVFPWCPEVSPRLISRLDSTPWHESPANQVSVALQGPECPPRAAGADPSAEESARASWGCSGGCAGSKERSFKMQMSRTTPLFNCRGSSSVDFSKESSAREKHCPGRCWGAEWRFALCGCKQLSSTCWPAWRHRSSARAIPVTQGKPKPFSGETKT